jgi:tetratricopeptide (TPR) repeat protein
MQFAIPILIALCTFVTFLPALDAGFTNWDDDKVITDNPHIRGLTSEHVGWMFTENKMGHYHPLTWISYGLDHAISQSRFDGQSPEIQKRYVRGLDPKIVHLTNVIYHMLTVVAFYFLVRLILRISIQDPPQGTDYLTPIAAALAAMFFGCHPLRVENAVWVTERRDVLSAMFLIPCLYFYLRYVLVNRWGRRKTVYYVASILLLALSLLSKAWGITLPAAMLVMDVYPLRRIGGRAGWSTYRFATVVIEKIPFLVLALTFAIFARAAQADQRDTMKSLAEWGVGDRVAQFFYGLFWYSYKTLIPIDLPALVPLPPNNNPLAARYVVAAIIVFLTAALLIRYRKRAPGLVVMAICYVGVLSPILGIAQSGPQLVADKYAYLGCIPWAIVFGFGWLLLARGRNRESDAKFNLAAPSIVALIIVATFATLTWKQSKHWKDSYALWSHAVDVEPECAIAQMNLGLLEKQNGNIDKAIEHYEISRRIDPNNPLILTNLSLALREKLPDNAQPADYDPLIELHQQAIAIQPHLPDLYFAMGNTLVEAGRFDEALAALRKCVTLRTSAGQIAHPKYHRALGTVYMRLKQWDNASLEYEAALKLETNMNPKGMGVINALDRLGRIREEQGRRKEAAAYFRRLLEIDPDNGPATRWLTEHGE